MAKWNLTLSDMHRVEAQHLRDKLRIAIEGLEEIRDVSERADGIRFYSVLAEKTLARIEGDE